MQRQSSISIFIVFATSALAILLTGCSLDPAKAKVKYLESGKRYMEKGNREQAIIQFQNALKQDPRFTDAFLELGKAHLANHDLQNADKALRQAIVLDPGRTDSHLSLGELYLNARMYSDAEKEGAFVVNKEPANGKGYELLGLSFAQQRESARAIEALSKAAQLQPKDANAHVNLALAELSVQQYKAAEEHLQQAIALDAHSAGAYSNLANLYRLRSDVPHAEQILQQGVESNPDNDALYLTWADIAYAGQKKDAADVILNRLRDRRPKSAPTAMLIGDFYSDRQETEKALAEYRRGVQLDSKNIEIKNRMVERYLEAGHTNEAEKLNAEVRHLRPQDLQAGITLGRILLAEGKNQEAVEQFLKMVPQAPDAPRTHYYLAVAHWRDQNLPRAKVEMQNALKLSPNMLQAQRDMVGIHLGLGEVPEAERLAEELVRKNASVADRMLLGSVLLRKGSPVKSREEFLAARQLAPNDPNIAVAIARTYEAEQKPAQAQKELESALNTNPRSLAALDQFAAIAVKQNQRAKAIERVTQFVQSYPEEANGHFLLGTLHFAEKNYPSAKAEFQRALELNPKMANACIQLGLVYQKDQQTDQAVRTYENCLVVDPKLSLAHALLGDLYQKKKNVELAKQHYNLALSQSPNFALAANNLAWMYAQSGSDLDLALSLAQKAVELQPDFVEAIDTLAWIQYRKGLYAGAVPLLQDCVAKGPQSPLYHYHFGMALLANGDKKRATQELQTALRLNLSGEDAEQATKALRQN